MNTDHPQIAILLPGRADDHGWNASGAQACELLAARGLPTFYIEDVNPTAIPNLLEECSLKGFKLVVGHGCEFAEPVLQIAGHHPKICYFVMDQPFGSPAIPDNVCFLRQKQEEGAFLCGRLAAWLSQSGVLGFVGGSAVPTQTANGNAFRSGALSLRKDLRVLLTYAGTFEDRALGNELALDQIETGADVIMQTADTTGLGVLDACRQCDKRAIGYILDQRSLAPEHLVTSLIVDVAQIIETKARQVLAGSFLNGIWEVGLAEGMVGLAPLAAFVGQEIREDLRNVQSRLVLGPFNQETSETGEVV